MCMHETYIYDRGQNNVIKKKKFIIVQPLHDTWDGIISPLVSVYKNNLFYAY